MEAHHGDGKSAFLSLPKVRTKELEDASYEVPALPLRAKYQPEPIVADGEEWFEGLIVEMFSDGSMRAPRGGRYQPVRRAGAGAAWGAEHSSNFAPPLSGKAQTIGRAELSAALEVMRR